MFEYNQQMRTAILAEVRRVAIFSLYKPDGEDLSQNASHKKRTAWKFERGLYNNSNFRPTIVAHATNDVSKATEIAKLHYQNALRFLRKRLTEAEYEWYTSLPVK